MVALRQSLPLQLPIDTDRLYVYKMIIKAACNKTVNNITWQYLQKGKDFAKWI